MIDLPNGWAIATLDQLIGVDGIFSDGDWIESKDQDPNGTVRLVQLADIGEGAFRNRSNRWLTPEKADELKCTFLRQEDVLIARMPDPLGRACIYPGGNSPAVTAVDVCIIRPGRGGVDPRWLMSTINSPQIRDQVRKYETGTTRKRISRKNLAKIPLQVPPLAEQRRIVAALEDRISRLNIATADLARSVTRLRALRSSTLRKAVRGDLVEHYGESPKEWLCQIADERKVLAGRPYRPVPPLALPGFQVPNHWRMVSLASLSYSSGYGTSTKCEYGAQGAPVLRIPNIVDGEIDMSDLKCAVDTSVKMDELYVAPGDLLFVRTNGSRELIGRTAIVREHVNAAYASYLIRYRLVPCVPPEWVQLVLSSPQWREYIERSSASSAGQYNLSMRTLAPLPIPIPPMREMQKILTAVDNVVSLTSRIAGSCGAGLRKSETLRRTILQEAFAGRLVEQDPADEPASVLLERIRAERAARGPVRRARRGKSEKAPQKETLL
ncbi:restriction endonuclease subunit S [Spirillospora sp. NPDC047418]